jgi:hypothetical protein
MTVPTALNYEELSDVLRAIAARTAVDANFRTMALNDSHTAITEACGRSLPNGFSVRFVENYGSAVRTIILPDPIEDRDLLLDEDLVDMRSAESDCIQTCSPFSCSM